MSRAYTGGELLADRYQITEYLSEGGMQEVYIAEDTVFLRRVVVKVPKNESAVKRFKSTAVLSARITHPNIAKTLDYFEDHGASHLVEEFLPGGNLSESLMERLVVLDPHLVAKLLNHLARGLAAAHHVDVIHRDLKPSNIVLNGDLQNFSPKITDFGVAKMAQDSLELVVKGGTIATSKTAIGHLPYMAPELITDPGKVKRSADVWAIGALGYEMLSGVKPYGEGLIAVKAIVESAPLTMPRFVSGSRDFLGLGTAVFEIIRRCMNANEADRPTADELIRLTGDLCYGSAPRKWGTVYSRRGSTGSILGDDGVSVFFHSQCVYGPMPIEGDRVLFASFPGSPLPRAQPVVKGRIT